MPNPLLAAEDDKVEMMSPWAGGVPHEPASDWQGGETTRQESEEAITLRDELRRPLRFVRRKMDFLGHRVG